MTQGRFIQEITQNHPTMRVSLLQTINPHFSKRNGGLWLLAGDGCGFYLVESSFVEVWTKNWNASSESLGFTVWITFLVTFNFFDISGVSTLSGRFLFFLFIFLFLFALTISFSWVQSSQIATFYSINTRKQKWLPGWSHFLPGLAVFFEPPASWVKSRP